jgi:hypothetical protein
MKFNNIPQLRIMFINKTKWHGLWKKILYFHWTPGRYIRICIRLKPYIYIYINRIALKSNSNTVWFNFQTYIYIYIYISRDQMIANVTRLHFLVQAGRINLVFMNNLERWTNIAMTWRMLTFSTYFAIQKTTSDMEMDIA